MKRTNVRFPMPNKADRDKIRLLERLEHSKFTEKAEKKLKDPAAVRQIKKIAIALSRKVKESGKLVKQLLDYVTNGKDTGLKVAALAALIYFVSPLDFVPDFLPFVGFVDDISVMGIVTALIVKSLSASPKEVSEEQVKKNKADKREKTGTTIAKKSKNPIQFLWNHVFYDVHNDMKTAAEEQVWVRVKGQLLVVAISVGGMVIAALLILLFKKVLFR